MKTFLFATLISVGGVGQSIAAIALTSFSNTTIDFNSLPTLTANGTFSATAGVQTMIGNSTGFDGAKLSGSGSTSTALVFDNGTLNSGGIYNYGNTGSSDRALGMLASGSNVMAIGVELINNTGAIVQDLTISFTQENWRSSTTSTNTMAASYSTTASSSSYLSANASFTAATALDLVGPAPVGSNGALDGNLAGNRTNRTFTLEALNLPINASVFFRWQDVNETGNDAGLAIDDLVISLTAVPEPSSIVGVTSLALLAVSRYRRRRGVVKNAPQ